MNSNHQTKRKNDQLPKTHDAKQKNSKSKSLNTLQILCSLVGFVKPMSGFVLLAVILGILGFLCAAFIPTLAAYSIGSILDSGSSSLGWIFVGMGICALLRGVLRYGEQACNHYIAFKLLAHIRDLVFGKLRTLAPAKLDGQKKGDLIALITSDVELLEVFFAHTVSPVCIAFGFSILAVAAGFSVHFTLGLCMLVSYILVGVVLPVIISKSTSGMGKEYRKQSGSLSAMVLEAASGLKELIQFGYTNEKMNQIRKQTENLSKIEEKLKDRQAVTGALTGLIITLSGVVFLMIGTPLYRAGDISAGSFLTLFVFFLSSFGSVSALANLGTGLAQTIGAGERVIALLQEQPLVEEVSSSNHPDTFNAQMSGIEYGYDEKPVLKDFSFQISKGEMVGVSGPSGCGKSTLIKLLMHFYDPDCGTISFEGEDLKKIDSSSLGTIHN